MNKYVCGDQTDVCSSIFPALVGFPVHHGKKKEALKNLENVYKFVLGDENFTQHIRWHFSFKKVLKTTRHDWRYLLNSFDCCLQVHRRDSVKSFEVILSTSEPCMKNNIYPATVGGFSAHTHRARWSGHAATRDTGASSKTDLNVLDFRLRILESKSMKLLPRLHLIAGHELGRCI